MKFIPVHMKCMCFSGDHVNLKSGNCIISSLIRNINQFQAKAMSTMSSIRDKYIDISVIMMAFTKLLSGWYDRFERLQSLMTVFHYETLITFVCGQSQAYESSSTTTKSVDWLYFVAGRICRPRYNMCVRVTESQEWLFKTADAPVDDELCDCGMFYM